jgi:hypothetical protein
MKSGQTVALLHSTSHAIRAEKLLRTAGVACKLIPTPRELSSDCGICVRFDTRDTAKVKSLLAKAGMERIEVHDAPGDAGSVG